MKLGGDRLQATAAKLNVKTLVVTNLRTLRPGTLTTRLHTLQAAFAPNVFRDVPYPNLPACLTRCLLEECHP